MGYFDPEHSGTGQFNPTAVDPDRQLDQAALPEAAAPDNSVYGPAGREACDDVQGRIFRDEVAAIRGPVCPFGPVGHGGEYLDELGRVCGHGSNICVCQG